MWGFLPFQLSHHLIHGPTFRTFSEASLGSRWRKISGSCSKDGNSHGTFFHFFAKWRFEFPFSAGWWLSPTPLKNDGVRQLGWWNSQYMESHNPFMFQTTNQSVILRRMEFQSWAPAVGNAHVLATCCWLGYGPFLVYPKMPWFQVLGFRSFSKWSTRNTPLEPGDFLAQMKLPEKIRRCLWKMERIRIISARFELKPNVFAACFRCSKG